MKREFINRNRINTIGPINELKKYRISFFSTASIKTKLLYKGNNSTLVSKSLLTINVYNPFSLNNQEKKESN